MDTPIKKAISVCGSQSELARRLNISPQSVQQWAAAERIPIERVAEVEAITGIPRKELRPDIFGDVA